MMAAQAPADDAGLSALGAPEALRLVQVWRVACPKAGNRFLAAWAAG